MDNLVSIYIPTKNRLALLQRAVHSVLAQTHRPLELIIVSDGSTDGTCDYVRSLQTDVSVQLIHNPQSVGACAARNQALQAARGQFITGLDDDDIFLPHRISRFLAEWRRREQAGERFACLFDRRIFDHGHRVILGNMAASVSAEQLLADNAIGNQIFTTPERMRAAGGFDPAMPAWQDWDMWVRLLQQDGPAYNIAANSYIMDVSHEFERITLKSSDKIVQAARLFYRKHGGNRHQMLGILASLMAYEQMRMSLRDLCQLIFSGDYSGEALRQLRRRRFRWSWTSAIG